MATLLIADHEQASLDDILRCVRSEHSVLLARNWGETLEKFESKLWKLNSAVIDPDMPGLTVDSQAMLSKMIKSNPAMPIIVVGQGGKVSPRDFLAMGVFRIHQKPLNPAELEMSIERAVYTSRLMRKIAAVERKRSSEVSYYERLLGFDFDEISNQIFENDAEYGKTSVLIRAEPGSRPAMIGRLLQKHIDGQLLFARVCHEKLLNIFPHDLQDDDILLLEKIESLGIAEQQNLLDTIKARAEQNKHTGLRFRLVVSTSLQSEREAVDSPVLGDLLRKVGQMELRIDPLRLRKHELPDIIRLMFERKKRHRGTKARAISNELRKILVDYDWPLNYDELDLILEGLLLTCRDEVLEPKHLHQLDLSDLAHSKYPTLDDMVEEHIKKVLRVTMGNKSKAAKMLGITTKTLYARIRH